MIIGGYIGVVVLTAFGSGEHHRDCLRFWRRYNIDHYRSFSYGVGSGSRRLRLRGELS